MKGAGRYFTVAFFLLFLTRTALLSADEQLYPTLISVRYEEGAMLVTFEPAENKSLRYRIYRATSQISSETDLIDADFVAEITAEEIPYTDYPAADGQYTYAVTIVTMGVEQLSFVPFQNFTLNLVDYSPYPSPVEKIEVRQTGSERVLVYFEPVNPEYSYNLYVTTESLTDISEKNPTATLKGKDTFHVTVEAATSYRFVVTTINRLGVENRNIIKGKNTNAEPILVKRREEKKTQPRRTVREKTNKELIERNLRDNFLNGRYRKALGVFSSLLRDRVLTDSEKALTHLYIGQCYYYLEKKSTALKYFILAKDVEEYRPLSEAWIERCLSEME